MFVCVSEREGVSELVRVCAWACACVFACACVCARVDVSIVSAAFLCVCVRESV